MVNFFPVSMASVPRPNKSHQNSFSQGVKCTVKAEQRVDWRGSALVIENGALADWRATDWDSERER